MPSLPSLPRTARLRALIGVAAAAMVATSSVLAVPPAAAAPVACRGFTAPAGTCVNDAVVVGGRSYNADWYLPAGRAQALMLLQHGFSRGCGNLRGTSRAILASGVIVLCLNADMSGGNPALGRALGDALADRNLQPPNGQPLPSAIVVGGHSAGGHFASVVGARLATRGYPHLTGAILFDAVASGGFSANLHAISAGGIRPVLQVAARPSLANLYNNSFGALRGLANRYTGIQLRWTGSFAGIPYGSSCHTDVEAENTDALATLGSGCSPRSTQTARLREFAAAWAADLASGSRTPAYWCADAGNLATCGTRVRELASRNVPLAVPIR